MTRHASHEIDWVVTKTPEKTIEVTDSSKSKILTVFEETDHMQVRFHESKISLAAAKLSISTCGSPIEINSRSLEDLKVLVDATNEINKTADKKVITFSSDTMSFLEKQTNLKTTHLALSEVFEKQKANSPDTSVTGASKVK